MKFESELAENVYRSKYMLEGVDKMLVDPLKRIDQVVTKYYPELEEFAQIKEETQKLKRVESSKIKKSTEGICSECGNFGILIRQNGIMVCTSCSESM